MNVRGRNILPLLIRKLIASSIIASLLITAQGFLFFEALAAIVVPKVVPAGIGAGTGAAGGAGAPQSVRFNDFQLKTSGIGGLSTTLPQVSAVAPVVKAASRSFSALAVPEAIFAEGAASRSFSALAVPEAIFAEGAARNALSLPLPHGVAASQAVPLASLGDGVLADAGAASGRLLTAPHAAAETVRKETVKPGVSAQSTLAAVEKAVKAVTPAKAAVSLRRAFDSGSPTRTKSDAVAHTPQGARPMAGLRVNLQATEAPSFEPADYTRLKDLKAVLGEGTREGDGWISAFVFQLPDGGRWTARAAGLEGFLYTKMEYERVVGSRDSIPQLGDYFKYLDALLAPLAWTADLRQELAGIRAGDYSSDGLRNARLNVFLTRTIKTLRGKLQTLDKSGWGRSAHTYSILSRAYNRLKPGKNFFDSLDETELRRIRETLGADQVWLLDIFEIGDVRRWGTGGGSPYAIKGYRKIKAELGGVEAFSRFVRRAHEMGLRVRTDFIPNHTSLDSELIEQHPEAFIHILPPQQLSDEEIMAGTPREDHGPRAPRFYLIKSRNYPGREGRETKVLIHHPRTDYGDSMWIDMGQIDYSSRAGRTWIVEEALHLFGDKAVDSIRRDMAYYILNEGYYGRWSRSLQDERDKSSGWAREALDGLLRDFSARWESLNGAEVLAEITDAVKRRYPHAVMDDEAYSYFTGLSRTGVDGIYGKNTHDDARGQVGLYDALKSLDVPKIRAAMRNNIFRFWQRGGATMVNFVGNHDESNPVDTFGRSFRAAAATALLGGPILTYNGFELGTGQADMLGDLSGSVDRNKAIPFDVPVSISWDRVHVETRDFIQGLLQARNRNKDLFDEGAGDVLEPAAETPIVAWTASRKLAGEGGQKTLLVAANYHWDWAWGHFKLDQPVLEEFGAFKPRADRTYILRDAVLHKDVNGGQQLVLERTGKQLLEEGLFIHLAAGDAHVFEVEEIDPSAPPTGPPAGSKTAEFFQQDRANGIGEKAEQVARAQTLAAEIEANVDKRSGLWDRLKRLRSATWDDVSELLTNSAILAFLPLQVPQIIKNFGLIAAGTLDPISILPWMGYATGILGNMLLLSYFVSKKEAGAARVQAVGVLTSAVIVGQIFYAGFMPALAFWAVAPTVVIGLILNYLNFKGVINGALWKLWNRVSGLSGLVVLPLVITATFAATMTFWPAILAAAAGLTFLALQALGKLPAGLENNWAKLSAWTATFLFMFGPIAQLASNLSNPANLAGISVLTLLLGTAGNMLMLPRAVLTKDRIWFTGSYWAVAVGGWVVMLSMFIFGAINPLVFYGFSALLPLFTAFIFHRSMKHHRESFWKSIRFIFSGK